MGDVRLTGEYAEALTQNATASLRFTSQYIEVLSTTAPASADVLLTSEYVEVLLTIVPAPVPPPPPLAAFEVPLQIIGLRFQPDTGQTVITGLDVTSIVTLTKKPEEPEEVGPQWVLGVGVLGTATCEL
jgi:hypothetical protein